MSNEGGREGGTNGNGASAGRRAAVLLLTGLAGLTGFIGLSGLAGCGGYETAYERAVYDAEPVYCYRTVADPDCYRAAEPAAHRRLVNYYGPSPRRTKAPPPAEIRLDPPPLAEARAAAPGGRTGAEAVGEGAQPPGPQPASAPAAAPRLGGEGPGDER